MQGMIEISCLANGDCRSEHFFVEASHIFCHAGENVRPHVDALLCSAEEVGWFVVACDSALAMNQICTRLLAHLNASEEIFCVLLGQHWPVKDAIMDK